MVAAGCTDTGRGGSRHPDLAPQLSATTAGSKAADTVPFFELKVQHETGSLRATFPFALSFSLPFLVLPLH